MLYADIAYPKPEAFFSELCLLDDVPEGSVPTDVPIMKEVWPDYTFAEEWPEQTATTLAPSASGVEFDIEDMIEGELDVDVDTDPSFTCTPSPVPEEGGDTKKNTGTRAVSGRKGLMGMTAIVSVVVGVAFVL